MAEVIDSSSQDYREVGWRSTMRGPDGFVLGHFDLPPARLGSRFDEAMLPLQVRVSSQRIRGESSTFAGVVSDSGSELSCEQAATATYIRKCWVNSLMMTIPCALVRFYSSLMWHGYWDRDPVEEFGEPAPQLPTGVFLEDWVRPECFYYYTGQFDRFGVEIRPAWSKLTIGLWVAGVAVIVCPAHLARNGLRQSPEAQRYFRRIDSWSHLHGHTSSRSIVNPMHKVRRRWVCDISLPLVTTADGWTASAIERLDVTHPIPVTLNSKDPSISQVESAAWLVESSPVLLWNVSKAICNWFLSSGWRPYWVPRPDESVLNPAKILDSIKVEHIYLGRVAKSIGFKLSVPWTDRRIGVIVRPTETIVDDEDVLINV